MESKRMMIIENEKLEGFSIDVNKRKDIVWSALPLHSWDYIISGTKVKLNIYQGTVMLGKDPLYSVYKFELKPIPTSRIRRILNILRDKNK